MCLLNEKIIKRLIIKFIIIMLLIFGSNSACSLFNERFPPSEYEIGHIDLGSAYVCKIERHYAYIGTNDGVSIINFEDPHNPFVSNSIQSNEAVFGIYVAENKLFFGDAGQHSLEIYNISEPENPVRIASLPIPGVIEGISKCDKNFGEILYVATYENGLIILNIADLQNINILSTMDCEGHGFDLICHKNFVYYANGDKGIQVINVMDPSLPVIINTLAYGVRDVSIKDNLLAAGHGGMGFSLIDISTPDNPIVLSSRRTGGDVWGICLNDNYLFTGDLELGVEIWDISDLENPNRIKTISEYSVHDIEFNEGYIFLADQDRHFVILDNWN